MLIYTSRISLKILYVQPVWLFKIQECVNSDSRQKNNFTILSIPHSHLRECKKKKNSISSTEDFSRSLSCLEEVKSRSRRRKQIASINRGNKTNHFRSSASSAPSQNRMSLSLQLRRPWATALELIGAIRKPSIPDPPT